MLLKELADAIAFYISPLLSLAATLLLLLTCLSPVKWRKAGASLVVVNPSLHLPNGPRNESVDFSLFLGPLGTSIGLQVPATLIPRFRILFASRLLRTDTLHTPCFEP